VTKEGVEDLACKCFKNPFLGIDKSNISFGCKAIGSVGDKLADQCTKNCYIQQKWEHVKFLRMLVV
jgi:hypothetical protein